MKIFAERWFWQALALVLLLSLITVISLDAWGLSIFGGPVDYVRFGNWSDFLAGAGTLIAVVAAFSAILFDQHKRRADQQNQRTSLYFWLKPESNELDGQEVTVWDVIIENRTNNPIYEWKLIIAGDEARHLCNYCKRPLLPCEGGNSFNVQQLDDVPSNRMPSARLIFRDENSEIWSRLSHGSATRAHGDDLMCEHRPRF